MRITRLYLRNYRVYEDELDLEIPPGLVGIYGPNGAGKSYLIESIRWTLFGKSRTSNDDIRTSGVNGDCITEVEFEHEGHLYRVQRTITGINSTVRASAWADNQHICEGPRDVAQYVHSILGMDDAAFRSSVFAEQNQVAAFSQQTPAKRRDLVLRLLGITPLDQARDEARRDAKAAANAYETLRTLLPDLDELTQQVADRSSLAKTASENETAATDALMLARKAQEGAEAGAAKLNELAKTYSDLVNAGKAARQTQDQAVEQLKRLEDELTTLESASEELERLSPLANGLEETEAQLRLLDAVVEAETELADIHLPERPQEPDEAQLTKFQIVSNEAMSQLAVHKAGVQAAKDELERVNQAHQRSASLSTEHDCPLCGQELGAAFEQVQAHRTAELDEARSRLEIAEKEYESSKTRCLEVEQELKALTRGFEQARLEFATFERMRERHEEAQKKLAHAHEALGKNAPELAKGVLANDLASTDQSSAQLLVTSMKTELATRRKAREDCQRLQGRLDRKEDALKERDKARERAEKATEERKELLEKVTSLNYSPDDLETAQRELEDARKQTEEAVETNQHAAVTATKARADAGEAERRLADAQEKYKQVHGEQERARHLGRTAELLSQFRNTVVSTVGPRLAAQAADLFAELTDNEYDRLEVDADTYEIQIRDAGRLYDMSRFSGSETDLANLALRVAISEHVRFQSGGAVGLLVLDEVFGPLDDERRERMLMALERLKGHFRQVMVVTHSSEVKQQLPNAIEVVKLPGRRATARLLVIS